MKYRIVWASWHGPAFSEWATLEEVVQFLMMLGRKGLVLATESIWVKKRGKWVALNPWQFDQVGNES